MPPRAKCLNPVFTKWLEEIRDEINPDSKYWNVLNRAVKAMRVHEKYLEHPKDCAEVKFIGPKIRDQLIQRYNESQGTASSPIQKPSKPSASSGVTRRLPSKPKVVSHPNTVESSSDESQEIPLSRLDHASLKNPLDQSTTDPPIAPNKRFGKGRKMTNINTLSSPDSDTNATNTTKATRTKQSSQPPKIISTPQNSKRTKPIPARPRLSNFIPAPAATSDIEADTENDNTDNDSPLLSFEPLVLPACSYTIQLILDEREIKSTKNRDYILKGLRKRGVNAEKRALEIGDVCWIARSNDPVDGDYVECVLDYIVERKRMDDLKSSILDGRFHEQKFRLKHTGISRVYYLVEDYDTERIVGQWGDQINTALSSTQVIDRFFLKQTTSIEDTLNYLARLHDTILKIHKSQDLYIIPPQMIKRHRFLALKQEINATNGERTYHTTYESYQYLNRKNGFYTLQDNMARILQCIRGLSEEKIASLIEHYPTPRSLYEAFKEAEERSLKWGNSMSSQGVGKGKGKKVAKSGEPAEMMLAELGGQGRRKIGSALSKHIYDVFMASAYESGC